MLAICVGIGTLAFSASSASARPTGPDPSHRGQVSEYRDIAVVGGLSFRVPPGLGTPSSFAYDYDEVAFDSTVWESQVAAGWRVDLHITVMRGERLDSPASLHDWFIAYQDRPADEAVYTPVRIRGHRGWQSDDQAFWLIRPGLAVSVTLDTTRWSHHTMLQIARSCR